MRFLCRFCLLVMLSGCASAIEATDSANLDVHVENLAEPIEVDGASFRIRRATGPDTFALVERVRQRWNAEGSAPRVLQSGGWHLISRWSGDSSEVLQWRTTDGNGEAVHSRFRPIAGRRRARPAPFTLPANCAWGRSIAGHAGDSNYFQLTGYCKGSPETGRTALLAMLREADWQVKAGDASMLKVTRDEREATLVVARGNDAAGYGLIWIDVREAKQSGLP